MHKIWKIICCALAVLSLSSCGQMASIPKENSVDKPVSIMVATDLHYLSSQLTDDSELSMRVLTEGDGRTMLYIQEVVDSFVAEVIDAAPDVVILSGDLTFNGEYVSHTDLIKSLKPIREAGIPVLVMPGNHDLDNLYSASFNNDNHEPVDSISAEDFRKEYADFGYKQALRMDEVSGSYLYAVRSDLWVLMMDTNSTNYGAVTDEMLAWVEEQLQFAEEKGAKVLAVSHQNLLIHSPLFDKGIRMGNAEKLANLYVQYDVLCNLSGHMHMQHITEGAVPDIATSSLPLTPNQYGVMEYDGATLSYETKPLDVAAWAQNQGIENEDLLNFAGYSYEMSMRAGKSQIMKKLAESSLSEEDKQLLAETFAIVNTAYFAGDVIDTQAVAEGLALWEENAESFRMDYIKSILEEADVAHHSLTITVGE